MTAWIGHTLVVRFEQGTGRTQVCCPCRPRDALDVRGEALQEPADQTWGQIKRTFAGHADSFPVNVQTKKPEPQSRFSDRPRHRP